MRTRIEFIMRGKDQNSFLLSHSRKSRMTARTRTRKTWKFSFVIFQGKINQSEKSLKELKDGILPLSRTEFGKKNHPFLKDIKPKRVIGIAPPRVIMRE
ncbi:MAG: hypothetical protein MUP98_03905 [Candidatus Aminicenantes bacterium]|nr:hypothetical protein [Candidatus Aminicenantes bacterium]